MKIDRNGLLVLDRDDCLRHLRDTTIGRVAVSIGALPAVFPVNFVVAGEDIIFRTTPGTKLVAAMNHTVVAFEVDAIEPLSHAGWSVMVTGHASVIDDPEHIADAERLPLLGWAISGPHSYVRIEGEVITGRRLDPIMRASVHSFSGGGQRTCPGCAGAIIATSDGEDTNFFCPSCGRCWHVEMGFVSSVDPGTCPGCRFHQVCEAVSP